MIKDYNLLKKYDKIWDKVSNSISEPVYNEKNLKTKIKPYGDKINKNFHDGVIRNKNSHSIYLSVILIDSV